MTKPVLAILSVTTIFACRDLSVPEPPNHVHDVYAACAGSTVQDFLTANPNAKALDDVAAVTCKIDEKLNDASFLASTAATVCAHALNAYAQSMPQTVAAAWVATNGNASCAQTQSQCGYAFFIYQKSPRASELKLLGPGGCGVAASSGSGVLFACCVQPAPPPDGGSVHIPTGSGGSGVHSTH
jgi:hypothetical protein